MVNVSELCPQMEAPLHYLFTLFGIMEREGTQHCEVSDVAWGTQTFFNQAPNIILFTSGYNNKHTNRKWYCYYSTAWLDINWIYIYIYIYTILVQVLLLVLVLVSVLHRILTSWLDIYWIIKHSTTSSTSTTSYSKN